MFDIEYKGGNALIIATKKATLVVDPKLSVVGLKDVSVKGVIELATEERLALNSDDVRLSIEGPGEYEAADFSIRGIAAQRHIDVAENGLLSTIYRIEIGDVRIALLGNIVNKLSEDQLESLGVVDILILPIGGGGYTLDATAAAGLVRSIDAKVIIPVHYADSTLKYEVPQDELSTFVSELGAPVETVSKYKVKGSSGISPTLSIIEITRS